MDIVPEVARRFEAYIAFLKDRKLVQDSPVILKEKRNNVERLDQTTILSAASATGETHLIVEASKRSPTHFGFKIRAFDFSPSPCFRFDADSGTHNNIRDDIPLSSRQVTTPHFHRCEADGVMIAYKTQTLLDDKNADAIQRDMTFALAHFCQEANIRDVDDEFPQVLREQPLLPLTDADFDPLNGVTFAHEH